ncbi:MAG: hypothetical protein HQL55_14120, partial [Magnetococcales bacterium]|nr:hypothetical protein [Magnetococcales bacterium]
MLQVEEQELQGVDRLFVSRLLEQLAKQLNLNHDLLQQLEASVLTRIVAPRRSEIQGHLHGDRLRQENRDMVIALRTALGSVPRQLLDDAVLRWRESQIMLTMQAMREVLLRLELRLGDNQLGQVYTGCVNLLDRAVIKSQAIPINWEGFRYRLIFAAGDDLTPRGHLNYFCNCAAKVMEALLHRGYEQKILRNLLEASIQQGVELVAIHRQEYFSRQIQGAVHEMGDALSNIMRVVEEVIKNVAAAVTIEGERKERLVHGINGFRTRRAKLIRNLAQVESSGVPLPTGLRERLQEVVVLAKDLLSNRDTLADHPERFVSLAQGIKHIKRKAQAVSFEFRRVRRKSEALLRRNLIQLGGEEAEDALGSIEGHQQRVLVEAAQALIWSYQDASYALELHNLAQQVELMRMKAAMLDEKVSSGVIGQLEATLRRNPFDVFRFRMAGKRMLAMVMDVLRPVPINLIASHEEEEIWAAVADLSDAYQRFSRLIEGEEAERLEELPEVLQELQQSVGRIRQDKVLTIPITPALDREKKCQNGELRLSIAERLDNLNAPLRDLVRVSLTIGRGDSHFLVARQRAMHTLGVTRDSEPE